MPGPHPPEHPLTVTDADSESNRTRPPRQVIGGEGESAGRAVPVDVDTDGGGFGGSVTLERSMLGFGVVF